MSFNGREQSTWDRSVNIRTLTKFNIKTVCCQHFIMVFISYLHKILNSNFLKVGWLTKLSGETMLRNLKIWHLSDKIQFYKFSYVTKCMTVAAGKALKKKWDGHWVETFTWNNFTAHGDRLERFPRRLSRAGWLSLWDNLTACSDGLKGRVAMGTQSYPVTNFGSGWGAFTSAEAGAMPPRRPPHLCFDER